MAGWAGRTRSVVVTINSTYLSLVHCCSSKHGPNHHHHHQPQSPSSWALIIRWEVHSSDAPHGSTQLVHFVCIAVSTYSHGWLAGWPPPVIDHPPPRTTNITIDSTVLQTNTHTLDGIEIERVTATGWWRRKWLTTKHLLERLFWQALITWRTLDWSMVFQVFLWPYE